MAVAGAAAVTEDARVVGGWQPGQLTALRRSGHVAGPPSAPSVALPRVPVTARSSVRLPASTYRRRRAVAAGLVVVLVLGFGVALGMLGGGPLAASERPTPSNPRLAANATYVVQPGDTLWSIARRLRPGVDPRPLVDRLVALHGGTTLYVGEHLTLPAS